GRPVVCNDTLHDPVLQYLKIAPKEPNIRATASFPIKKFGKTVGVFSFIASKEYFFDSEEVSLLTEVADNLSFAVEILASEELRKQTQIQVLQSEAKLKKAQTIAHIGHWDLDFSTGVSSWSEESCRIYGFDSNDNEHTFDEWISFLHPDDKD